MIIKSMDDLSLIKLENGSELKITELYETKTYLGVLHMDPDKIKEVTESKIKYHKDETPKKHLSTTSKSPYLFDPELRENGKLSEVVCVANLESSEKIEKDSNGSFLTIVWFQDSYGLPNNTTLDTIRSLNWEELADSFYF